MFILQMTRRCTPFLPLVVCSCFLHSFDKQWHNTVAAQEQPQIQLHPAGLSSPSLMVQGITKTANQPPFQLFHSPFCLCCARVHHGWFVSLSNSLTRIPSHRLWSPLPWPQDLVPCLTGQPLLFWFMHARISTEEMICVFACSVYAVHGNSGG